jgi:hypothetical protein
LPQQGFSMFGVPDENPLFSFDEVTAKAPYQEMRKGGRLRKKFATDGSVEGGEEDAEQTEPAADEPVARTEEPALKADVDGSVEYAPSDFVLPSSIQKKQPGFGNFEQEWRNDPLSQLLWNLGVQLVKNDRLPLDQAFMAAAPYAIKGLGDAIDYQRALEQKKAEAQQSAEFMRRLYPEGMASGGIVRKKYATNGAVMDEGGDFFGDLGSLFGGEEQQPAPRHGHAAPAQPQQGFDILGSLFGGEEEPQPRAGRAQPMAYAQQQDPIGGFFDSIFGPEEQPQPARKGAAQPQYQPEPSSNFLDDILGGIFGGGEQPRLPTQPMAQPRTPEKATGAPATPEKPAVAEPKTETPPTTTPATGDKTTTPAAPAARAEPAKPEASGSIFNNPQVKQIDAEMRRVSSLYSQVQTEADARAIRQRMADLNSQRQQTLNMLKYEQERADKLAAAANKPKPLTPAEKAASDKQKIEEQGAQKRYTSAVGRGAKIRDELGQNKESFEKALYDAKKLQEAFTQLEPGQFTKLNVATQKFLSGLPFGLDEMADKKLVSAAELIGKLNISGLTELLSKQKGVAGVGKMKLDLEALPDISKQPEAIGDLLSILQAGSKTYLNRQEALEGENRRLEEEAISAGKDYQGMTDNQINSFLDKWNSETDEDGNRVNSYDYNVKQIRKGIHVKGEPSERQHLQEPAKSEGQPKYSIQPGHAEGDWIYKGGDPNDKSNWEHK